MSDTPRRPSSPTGVVVGVDGTPGCAGALRYAVAEARRRGLGLTVAHVVPDGIGLGPPVVLTDFDEVGRSILAKAAESAAELAPELAVDTELATGQRSRALASLGRDAALLVLGRDSRAVMDRLLIGTTTAATAAHAPCSVVAVPSFWVDGPRHRRVVVGVKSDRGCAELLEQAFTEAARRSASLDVVTAWHLADPYFDRIEARTHESDWVRNATQVLDRATAPLRTRFPDVVVETRVVHGRPAGVLLRASQRSDLVLVSGRRFALPPYGRLGSVGHSLLRLSDVPVQVVPYTPDPQEELVLEEAGELLK